MVILFWIFIAALVLASVKVHYEMIHKMNVLEKKMSEIGTALHKIEGEYIDILDTLVENIGEVDDKIVQISNQVDRSLLDLRQALEPTKPIKPNNWDSVRKAFQGPVKVDNERD